MSKDIATKQDQSPKEVLRRQFDGMGAEFLKVLPEHVTLDRFVRIVLTAVSKNSDLLDADRNSLLGACLDCATDGLIPDGKKAALVIFKNKVVYMPMIWGIHEKLHNAGDIKTLSSEHVYNNDQFRYWRDEKGPHLEHEPSDDHGLASPETVRLVYAVCELKNGAVEIERMNVVDIEAIRRRSKTPDKGPWASDWGEMARKTVERRLSKRLPMSSEQEKLMQRVDSMYDLDREQPPEQRPAVDAPPRPKRVEYQPEPPAHGEDFDKQFRQHTADHAGDKPEDETESASGPEGSVPAKEPPTDEQGRDQRRTPAPAAEAAENGGHPSKMLADLRIGLGKQKSDAGIDAFLGQATMAENIAELSEDEQSIWHQDVENAREALAQMA